jgi:AcrR family transcriptional regulator
MRRDKRGPGRPPGNTSDATRANILRAARTCFASKGFGVATNRDIAERAGVTPAAIYQYFDSKVALYVAAARETAAEVAADMRVGAAEGENVADALSGIVRRLLVLHEEDPSRGAFLAALPSELQRHPEIARQLTRGPKELDDIMAAVVARGVASGEIDADDAGGVADMFIACMMGLSQHAALHGRSRPGASVFAALLEGRLFSRTQLRVAGARRAPKKPVPTRKRA